MLETRTDMQPLSYHLTNPIPMPPLASKPGSGRYTRKVPMRIIATTICALTLGGCASNLPYSIAIGDPSESTGRVGQKDCVLRLDDIVEKIASDYSSSKSTVRSLQIQFEKKLHEDTQALEHCNDGNGNPVQPDDYPPIEEVAKKWLTTYALDTTNPDQGLDRFREYLRSAQLVQHLANQQLLPDEDTRNTYFLVENIRRRQSQWCGDLTPQITKPLSLPFVSSPAQTDPNQQPQMQARTEESAQDATEGSSCLSARSLYHVQTVLMARDQPKLTNLYTYLLDEIVRQERPHPAQRNQRYFMLGYEIPWDADRTLVRYGVTFYFRQAAPEIDESTYYKQAAPAIDESANSQPPVQLIGYDLIYANEATPAPFVELGTDGTTNRSKEGPSPWQENPWRITGYPFSLVIGLKNAAFEIAKLPFSTIAGLLFGRDAYNYPLENLLTAYDTLYLEATTQTHRGAEWGLYRLLTETPLVGQLFQYNFGGDRSEPDELSQVTRRKIFLSRGIYGGNKWGQDTGLWTLFANLSYPTYDIYSPPYRHGTVIDVIWSMFNLSHGPAFSEARYVMDHATRKDRLYLAGHSGGVQRSAAASRILSNLGYRVVKVMGIAGPSVGQALVDPRYPEAFKVYLNTGLGANQDVVSKVGGVAGAFSTLLDYTVIVPLKYTIGGLVFWDRDRVYRIADRFGFSNASIVEVQRKPSSRHQTPMRLAFTDHLIFDAYIRNEFSTAFQESLERPDHSEPDRPHAFPWER